MAKKIKVQEPQKKLKVQHTDKIIEKKKKKDKKLKINRLIIRNLVFDINEKHLKKLLSPFGAVKQITIPTNPDKKGSKGFAFVQYETMRSCEKAIKQLNGKVYKGRQIVLDFSIPKIKFQSQKIVEDEKNNKNEIKEEPQEDIQEQEQQQQIKKEQQSQTKFVNKNVIKQQQDLSSTVFVRNLPINVKDQDLYNFFKRYGKLKFAVVVKDKQTGNSKGTGFVKFIDSQVANNLINYSRSYEMYMLKKLFHFKPDPSINLELQGTLLKLFPSQKRQEIEQKIKNRQEQQEKPQKKVVPLKKIKRLDDLINFDVGQKRSIHLAKFGRWEPNEDMHEDDQIRFKAHYKQKILKLKNPNNSVSDKRIILKFLDKDLSEGEIRQVAVNYLSQNNLSNKSLTYCKLMLTDNMTKSAGFAFLQFKNHEIALSFIEFLCQNPEVLQQSEFVCQFAIQDSRKLMKLKRRNKK